MRSPSEIKKDLRRVGKALPEAEARLAGLRSEREALLVEARTLDAPLSHAEIADSLDAPLGTTSHAIKRAMDALA